MLVALVSASRSAYPHLVPSKGFWMAEDTEAGALKDVAGAAFPKGAARSSGGDPGGDSPKPPPPPGAGAAAKPVDPFEEFKEMLAEQGERQARLRHVQQFLNSPGFVDLREQAIVVSDPPEAIEERKRDLDYRIRVLESLVSLLIEERDSLDKVRSAQEPPAA